MRKFFIAVSMLFAGLTTQAQGTPENGDLQLNTGVGLSNWGIPVYVGLDYGVGHDITVGAEVSYQSYSENYAAIKHTNTAIGFIANGNYHFNRLLKIPSKFDVYAGLNFAYYYWSYKVESKYSNLVAESSNNNPIGFGVQVGGRYFFNDVFAVNFQIGGGSTSGARVGITYKF